MLQFFLSLALALLLNLDLKLRWLARTLALVPWAIPPVIVAIMWRLMLHPRSGAVNEVLRELGFAGDTNWLGDFKYALPAAILVGVWAGMPQTTITLLAGLQSVPEELSEAAAIDGAGSVRRFFHVTLPALRPIIVAITTLDLINNFNSFALVYTLTAGGPGGKTMLPSLFVYNEAFQFGHWGYAAAMGNVMVIVVGTFLVLYLWGNRRAVRLIRGRHTTLTRPLQYLALAVFMVFLAFPVVFLLVTALKPQSELLDPDPSFLPKEIDWSNFTEAIEKTRFWTTARNSAVVATVTMA